MTKLFYTVLVFVSASVFVAGFSPLLSQTPSPQLVDTHTKAGSTCTSCHPGGTPSNKVGMSVCAECHGNYAKVAIKTLAVAPNPHESHLGEVECTVCHHAHKPSEDGCRSCHDFGYKVP